MCGVPVPCLSAGEELWYTSLHIIAVSRKTRETDRAREGVKINYCAGAWTNDQPDEKPAQLKRHWPTAERLWVGFKRRGGRSLTPIVADEVFFLLHRYFFEPNRIVTFCCWTYPRKQDGPVIIDEKTISQIQGSWSLDTPINSILTFQKREKDSIRNIHIDLNTFENPLTFTSLYVFFPDHRGARKDRITHTEYTECWSLKIRRSVRSGGGWVELIKAVVSPDAERKTQRQDHTWELKRCWSLMFRLEARRWRWLF